MNDSMESGVNASLSQPLPQISAYTSIVCCFALSVIYVSSLYIWRSEHSRDHPSTVKRRFCSVIVVMFISPIFVYKFSSPELFELASFPELLGLRWLGLWQALCIPLLLTMLLFFGPLCLNIQNGSICLLWDLNFWKECFQNILWVRNHIVAPLSEEFVFRACMMPLILQSFSPITAVFITPLFFGTAHFHHIAESLSMGMDPKTAVIISCFQLTYTTLFGFYSAFLFARTGHFVAPFLVHAFCNQMGFPDLFEVWQQRLPRRIVHIGCYIVGFAGWVILLPIATEPSLYGNILYWNV